MGAQCGDFGDCHMENCMVEAHPAGKAPVRTTKGSVDRGGASRSGRVRGPRSVSLKARAEGGAGSDPAIWGTSLRNPPAECRPPSPHPLGFAPRLRTCAKLLGQPPLPGGSGFQQSPCFPRSPCRPSFVAQPGRSYRHGGSEGRRGPARRWGGGKGRGSGRHSPPGATGCAWSPRRWLTFLLPLLPPVPERRADLRFKSRCEVEVVERPLPTPQHRPTGESNSCCRHQRLEYRLPPTIQCV